MTDTRRLDGIIRESGYKYSFIASSLGICYQALRNKLDNKSEFLPTEIDAMCKMLHITDLEEKESIFFAHDVEHYSTEQEV